MASPLETLFLIALGRLCIYLWMEFPVPEWFEKSRYGKLHDCSLCSGVWIYSILFTLFRVDILSWFGLSIGYGWGIPQGILGGALISFIMHLLEIGWKEKFMGIVID